MASLVGETRRQSAEAFSIARDEDQIMTAPCQPIGIDAPIPDEASVISAVPFESRVIVVVCRKSK
jgi:hypothetical protein